LTAELNIHLEHPVSTKTVRRELHKSNIHSIAATAKTLISENNTKKRQRWCDDHKSYMSGDKYVMWTGKPSFTSFPTSGRVYVWQMPQEAYNAACLVSTVKHGGGSVTIGQQYFGILLIL
jgi:hypothetical protein